MEGFDKYRVTWLQRIGGVGEYVIVDLPDVVKVPKRDGQGEELDPFEWLQAVFGFPVVSLQVLE